MRRKAANKIIILLMMTVWLSVIPLQAFETGYTFYTLKKGYGGQKYEPQSGCLLGAYVAEDPVVNKNSQSFNVLMEKQHASFFRYVGYGQPFPEKWVEEVKAAGGIPHIALEPNHGLEKVNDDAYLRNFAKAAKTADVPIFLRYASEMNGSWTEYSNAVKLYKEKWKIVHRVMEEEAPNVMMVWTVFTFPESRIDIYYPGDEYVDWVGVNIYSVIYHNNQLNQSGADEDPLKLLDYVYNKYSYKKPIQISEFGVTHYTVTDGQYYSEFAQNRIRHMYTNLKERYPRVKSIFYFNVNTLNSWYENRRINDYSLTTDSNLLNTYKQVIKDNYYLSSTTHIPINETWDEQLTYNTFYKMVDGVVYIDIEYIINYLEIPVLEENSTTVTFKKENQVLKCRKYNYRISKGYGNESRKLTMVPLRQVVECFGYVIEVDEHNKKIYIFEKE